jgi:hypothetical protein
MAGVWNMDWVVANRNLGAERKSLREAWFRAGDRHLKRIPDRSQVASEVTADKIKGSGHGSCGKCSSARCRIR